MKDNNKSVTKVLVTLEKKCQALTKDENVKAIHEKDM